MTNRFRCCFSSRVWNSAPLCEPQTDFFVLRMMFCGEGTGRGAVQRAVSTPGVRGFEFRGGNDFSLAAPLSPFHLFPSLPAFSL